MERKYREILIDVFNRSNGTVKFNHFRRAQDFYVFENDNLIIKINIWRWLSFLYNLICGVSCFLIFIASFIFPVFSENNIETTVWALYELGILSLLACILFFFLSLPYISAYYIKESIKESS